MERLVVSLLMKKNEASRRKLFDKYGIVWTPIPDTKGIVVVSSIFPLGDHFFFIGAFEHPSGGGMVYQVFYENGLIGTSPPQFQKCNFTVILNGRVEIWALFEEEIDGRMIPVSVTLLLNNEQIPTVYGCTYYRLKELQKPCDHISTTNSQDRISFLEKKLRRFSRAWRTLWVCEKDASKVGGKGIFLADGQLFLLSFP